jgi:tetratricopeptide (TPR) repeat protein
LRQAFQIASSNELKSEVAGYIGSNYQRISKYPQSRKAFKEAIELTENPLKRLDYSSSLAFLDYLEGNNEDAVHRIRDVEKALLNIPGKSDVKDSIQASYLLTKAIIAPLVGDDINELDYTIQAIELFKKHDDLKGEATALNNMCDVYSKRGDYEQALDVLHQSESIATRLNDSLSLAIVHYNLAELYTELNQPTLATDYFQRYLQENLQISNTLGDGYANVGFGTLYFYEENYKLAETYFSKALSIFASIGGRRFELLAALKLIQSLLLQQKYAEGIAKLAEIEPLCLNSAGIEVHQEFLFVKGLSLHLGPAASEPNVQRRAAQSIRRSLETAGSLPIHHLMERYFYLSQAIRSTGNQDGYKRTLQKAVKALNAKMMKIGNPRIRQNICERKIIDRIVSAAKMQKICVD